MPPSLNSIITVIILYTTGVQPTVTFPIGDHVNVLHDYKKQDHKKF